MKIIRWVLIISALLLVAWGCGGGSSSSDKTGSVSVYVTDDLSDYQQVTATITGVQLLHSGSGEACDLVSEEQVVDIANLADTIQLLETVDCAARSYNRVRLNFVKAVEMMNASGVAATCDFTSYKESGNGPKNALSCTGDDCSLDITGAVNVIANTTNPFALDFDLKDFVVADFGLPGCGVTMKVSPLNKNDMDDKKANGYREGVTGYISILNTTEETFTLTTKRGEAFTVDYSQSLYDGLGQPGMEELLLFAADHSLKVRIMAMSIDVSGVTPIAAATILIKLDGRLTGLNDVDKTFTLTNIEKNVAGITVNYTDADTQNHVAGTLAEDIWVEAKLFGYENLQYLAHEVEVEEADDDDTDD
ncbi:DUF4382 domain-containing protein [Thermodesulfobacteriota bacterium]